MIQLLKKRDRFAKINLLALLSHSEDNDKEESIDKRAVEIYLVDLLNHAISNDDVFSHIRSSITYDENRNDMIDVICALIMHRAKKLADLDLSLIGEDGLPQIWNLLTEDWLTFSL